MKLALHGGEPLRKSTLPYGRQTIDERDLAEVVTTLRSDYLTTGPAVGEFEKKFAAFVGAAEAVAVSNGTAALHAAVFANSVGPGDEVIVPAMTFAASANCVVYQGGQPIFCDVDPETLLIDPADAARRVTPRTRGIIPVDYAGQPCDYPALAGLCHAKNLFLVADACHSLGGGQGGKKVGTLAGLNCFSLHPVKAMTSGEGGMITTDHPGLAGKMRIFRNHGITTDHHAREQIGSWFYQMEELGFNYRLTDFQCALGKSQLEKLPAWLEKRRQLAAFYDRVFKTCPFLRPLANLAGQGHAYHLYVIRLIPGKWKVHRDEIFRAMRAEGIGVNVHYIPVHLHPFYRRRFQTGDGMCPAAEKAYQEIMTLPLFPAMTENDCSDVVNALEKIFSHLGQP